MKKLMIFLAIMIGIIATLPWVDGYYTKKYYLALLNSLSQNNHIKIEIVEYQTGWLSSHVKIRYLDLIPPSEANPFKLNGNRLNLNEVTTDETITHGPFLFDPIQKKMRFAMARLDSTLHLPASMETMLLGKNTNEGVIRIKTMINFDQSWLTDMKIPTMSVVLPNNGKLIWQGMQGQGSFQTNNDQVTSSKSNLTLGTLTISVLDPKNPTIARQLTMQPINIQYEGSLQPIGLWAGKVNVTLPNLAIKSSDGANINLEKLNLIAASNVTGDNLIHLSENLTLNKLELPSNPIVVISPAKVDFSVNNLSAKGFLALQQFLQMISTNQNNIDPTQLRNQYLNILMGILTPSTTLDSSLGLNTSMGNLTITGRASLPANKNAPSNLSEAIVSGNAYLDIRVSTQLANQILQSFYANIGAILPSGNNQPAAASNQKDVFNQKMAELMQQGKIDLSNAVHFMDLYTKHPTIEQFTAEITSASLAPETSSTLVQLYTAAYNNTQPAQGIVAAPPTDKARESIQQWINQGYLIPDQNDYVISISQEAGTIKVNGKPLDLTSPSAASPTLPIQAATAP